MTFHISRSEVYQALSQVKHPEIQNHNLVKLGMIPEVIVEGTQVYIETYHSPAFERITDRVVQLTPIREPEPLLNQECD